PTGNGQAGVAANGTNAFVDILPFLEGDAVLSPALTSTPSVYNFTVLSVPFKTYICPSDITANAGAGGLGSYAVNFACTINCKYPATFTDGTSNTVIFSERVATCNNASNKWATTWFSTEGMSATAPTGVLSKAQFSITGVSPLGLQNANAKANVPIPPGG